MRATELFDQIEKFAEYSFNRSHSVSYALIAYQTAYLKANFFHEFMCSLLDNSMDDADKKEKYIGECFESGVQVLPPKINVSTSRFELTENKQIVFPLTAIKGLGAKICERVIKDRVKSGQYSSFMNFCTRVKPDKKTVVALLESNCFSEIETEPKKWLYLVDYLCSSISEYKKDSKVNILDYMKTLIKKEFIKRDERIQSLILEKRAIAGASKVAKAEKAKIDEKIKELEDSLNPVVEDELLKNNYGFSKIEISQHEENYLAYQITTNIKSIFQKYKKRFEFKEIEEICADDVDTDINTVGEVKDLKVITCKNKKKMAFAQLSYSGSSIGLTFFPSQWEDFSAIKNGDYIRITAHVQENRDKSYGEYNLAVNKMNRLSCLYGEETFVQDASGWTDEEKDIYKQGLTSFSSICYNKNEDIQKILKVKMKKNEEPEVVKAIYWISDLERYRQFLIRYGLMK